MRFNNFIVNFGQLTKPTIFNSSGRPGNASLYWSTSVPFSQAPVLATAGGSILEADGPSPVPLDK